MQKWEYCSVTIGWSGALRGNKINVSINHYSPDGNYHSEEINTDIKAGDYGIVNAITKTAAYLGQDGWEMVSFHTRLGGTKWEGEAIFKRRIETT